MVMHTSSPGRRRRERRAVIAALLALGLLAGAAGCDGGDRTVSPPAVPRDADVATTTVPGNPGADAATCQPGPGKKVTMLDDVRIPAINSDEVRVPDQVVGGRTVPGFTVTAVRVPAMVVSGGCKIEYDAPGGCLGAVEITAAELPAVEIPGFEIPAVDVGNSPYGGDKIDGARAGEQRAEGLRTEQVCQEQPADGQRLVARVIRPRLIRTRALRPRALRPRAIRPPICVGSECTPAVEVMALEVPAVELSATEVNAAELHAYELPDSRARRFQDDQQTAYVAPADVLFDFDQATLRPDAGPTLRAIAGDLSTKAGDRPVKVEGHTDSTGDPAYNQRLSEDRARAVATWLSTEGGVAAARISTVGLAESAPAAPNTNPDGSDNPAGRQANRRVVISVTSG
jgi:outer membrane protein OmpA-like peptidoglycan-associated protein